MQFRLLRTAGASAAVILLAACSEPSAITAPSSPRLDRSAIGGLSAPSADRTFSCFVSTRAMPGSTTWRYGSGSVRFPTSELAPGGEVTVYRGRGYAGSGELVTAVNCIIPRTPEAKLRMDRNLGVRHGVGGDAERREITATLRATGLEELVVVGNWCPYGGIYPNCRTDPTSQAAPQCGAMDPSCGGGGDAGGSDPWSWGGGGSEPAPDDACPATDPACLLPLSPEQRAALVQALSLVKTQYQDPQAAAACAELKAEAERLLPKQVFAGNSEIPDDPNNPRAHHDGQHLDGKIHIDEDVFDFAIYGGNYRVLALLFLHETAHVLGYSHPSETHEPYSARPFNYVSRDSGAETCV